MIIFLLIPTILTLVGQWIVYKKANKPGWHSLIPILNVYTKTKFTGTTKYFLSYVILSVVGSVFSNFLNVITLLLVELGAPEGVSIVLSLVALAIALVTFGLMVQIEHGVARAFGKGKAFGTGLVFLPFVFYPILAFGDNQYIATLEEVVD